MRHWLSVLVALSAGLAAAEGDREWLLDKEARVAAYVATKLDDFRVGAWRPEKIDPRQPLPEVPEEERKKIHEPVRLESPPAASRFFRDGDVLWDVSANLRAARVFAGDDGWAVFNETTRRLVLSGTRTDHLRIERFQGYLLDELPPHLALTLRLLRVHSEELDGVGWTVEEVQQRDTTELGTIALRSRPATKASARSKTEACEITAESEMNVAMNDEVVDVRLEFKARLGKEPGSHEIEIYTGVVAYNEVPFYLEVGSKDDPRHTLLVEARAEVQFPVGTPRSRWRVFANPVHEPPRPVPEFLGPEPHRNLGDGFILGRWTMPPTFLHDLSGIPEDLESDPFGNPEDPGGSEKGLLQRYPLVKDPDGIIGVVPDDVVLDVVDLFRESGIGVVKGGWVRYLPWESIVMAKLDAANIDLMDQLFEPGPNLPSMIRSSVSLIEWEGPAPEPGVVPRDALRLGRVALLTGPGQKSTLLLGRKTDEDGELLEGMEVEVEPNVGADDRIIDLRVWVGRAGEIRTGLSTGLTLHTGTPFLLPLGRVDGKSVGAVIEATVVGIDGRAR